MTKNTSPDVLTPRLLGLPGRGATNGVFTVKICAVVTNNSSDTRV